MDFKFNKLKKILKNLKKEKDFKQKLESRSDRFSEKIKKIFKKYNKSVIKEVVPALILKGRKRDVSVLFFSIKNIPYLEEHIDEPQLTKILDDYLKIILEKIFSNSGISEIIGSSILVFFNVIPQRKHELTAIKTALLIKEETKSFNLELREKFNSEIEFGIGINSGYAFMNITGNSLKYTPLGELVRIAQDLKEKAKENQILVTKAIHDRTSEGIKSKRMGIWTYDNKALEIFSVEDLSAREKFKPYIDKIVKEFS